MIHIFFSNEIVSIYKAPYRSLNMISCRDSNTKLARLCRRNHLAAVPWALFRCWSHVVRLGRFPSGAFGDLTWCHEQSWNLTTRTLFCHQIRVYL